MDAKDNQIRELQKQVRALQRSTIGEKSPEESWSDYAEKMFKDVETNRETLEVVSKIADQCYTVLHPKLKNAFESCRGNKWPADVKPCLRFNTGVCERGFVHWDKVHNKTSQKWIHICMVSQHFFHFQANKTKLVKIENIGIFIKSLISIFG